MEPETTHIPTTASTAAPTATPTTTPTATRTAIPTATPTATPVPVFRQAILPVGLTRIDAEAFEGSRIQYFMLQDGVKIIYGRAFADCKDLMMIRIPASVIYIYDDAFSGSPNVTFMCPEGSYAAQYAAAKGIPVIPE